MPVRLAEWDDADSVCTVSRDNQDGELIRMERLDRSAFRMMLAEVRQIRRSSVPSFAGGVPTAVGGVFGE